MKMIGMEGFQGKGNKKNSGRALSIPSSSPKPEGKNL